MGGAITLLTPTKRTARGSKGAQVYGNRGGEAPEGEATPPQHCALHAAASSTTAARQVPPPFSRQACPQLQCSLLCYLGRSPVNRGLV